MNYVLTPEKTERFWDYSIPKESGCWEWFAARTPNGYGVFNCGRIKGKDGRKYSIVASRVSYSLTFGDIPNGLSVCHICDNPSCVNPKHLFLGTQTENMKDMFLKGRNTRGERVPQSKLNSEQILEVRRLYAEGGLRQLDIANLFNVSRTLISQITGGRTWKHIGGPLFKRGKPTNPVLPQITGTLSTGKPNLTP